MGPPFGIFGGVANGDIHGCIRLLDSLFPIFRGEWRAEDGRSEVDKRQRERQRDRETERQRDRHRERRREVDRERDRDVVMVESTSVLSVLYP